MSLKLKSLLEKEERKMNPRVFMSNWFALVHPAHACFTFIHPAQKYNSAARQTCQQLDSSQPLHPTCFHEGTENKPSSYYCFLSPWTVSWSCICKNNCRALIILFSYLVIRILNILFWTNAAKFTSVFQEWISLPVLTAVGISVLWWQLLSWWKIKQWNTDPLKTVPLTWIVTVSPVRHSKELYPVSHQCCE